MLICNSECGSLCSSACDLRGKKIRLMDPRGALVDEIEITDYDGIDNETGEYVIQAPLEPGEYRWRAEFTAQEVGGILHEEDFEPLSFTVPPHSTSMAVWDIPSPIVLGAQFCIRVGTKCFVGCDLTGSEIEIHYHEGVEVASAMVGSDTQLGATALYWTKVELRAPNVEGVYKWTATLRRASSPILHSQASYPFVFRTVRPPRYVVTVRVIDTDTKAPVVDADVLLHPYGGAPMQAE